jgi:outer membrane protein assembly factor BamB
VESLGSGDPWQVGAYQLRARLGSGGMGQVFLGYSPAGRPVAVKVIHPELAKDPMFRTRFRREVAAARAVSGAYTAPVMAAGPDDDPPWLATAFVPGPSLADAVAAAGPLPEASLWKLAAGLVEALQAVHAAGLVHRDLKPGNVLLATDGPRVIDFGISAAFEGTRMTSTGLIVGTPSFMSPEQAEGARVGPESDVFSLGCVIVFAATGAGPFGDGQLASVLYRVVHTEPALDGVPAGLREVAAACLAKAPADRPTLTRLVDAVAAGLGPAASTGLTSFWPAVVTRLIGSYQDRLAVEIPAPPSAAVTAVQQSATMAQAGSGMPQPATMAAQHTGAAAPPAGFAAPLVADGTAVQPGYPGLPADLAGAPVPKSGVTRRNLLVALGLTAAAGAAGAAWELSHGSTGDHLADSKSKSGLGKKPVPRATHRAADQPAPQQAASPGAVASGKKVWSFITGNIIESPVVVSNGVVYFGSIDNNVYALNASSGARVWSYGTNAAVQCGIAVADGAVYASSFEGNLYRFDASSGTKVWSYPAESVSAASVAVAGGTVYTSGVGGIIAALNASDGAKKWDKFQDGEGMAGIALADQVVYLGTSGGDVYALHAASGDVIWSFAANGAITSGVALAGGVVYAGCFGQTVYALNAGSGRQAWTYQTGGQVASGITVANGIVYVGSDDGNLYALGATSGDLIWKFPTQGQVQSGITVAKGRVYAGDSDGNLYAVNARSGGKIWAFPSLGAIDSGIAVANGIVYFGGGNSLCAVAV